MVAPLGVRVPLFLHVTCRITLMRRDGAGRARELHFRRLGRGQEFVLDGKRHPAVYKYFVDRIKATAAKIHRCSHDF